MFFDRWYQIKAESKKIGLGVQDCGKMNVEMHLVIISTVKKYWCRTPTAIEDVLLHVITRITQNSYHMYYLDITFKKLKPIKTNYEKFIFYITFFSS